MARLIFLVSIVCFVKAEVFENVSLTLRSPHFVTQNQKTVFVTSDNSLENYVNPELKFNQLFIENQTVPELRANSVANLENITEIFIMRSGLQVIHPEAFKNIPKLVILVLSNNLLKEIKHGALNFIGSSDLRMINFDYNEISKIDDNSFDDLNLGTLFIYGNKLSQWKPSWFRRSTLKSISAHGNVIEELPEKAFIYNDQTSIELEVVGLTNNTLKTIHKEAFKGVRKISVLALDSNLLENLDPEVFSTVTEINQLELNGNKFKNFDPSILSNTKVDSLDLRKNQLECVSTGIHDSTKFSSLDLSGNPLTSDCKQTWTKWLKENKEVVVTLT